jgi:hypothetical protein
MTKSNPSDHFINSPAKLTQCPICKGWIYECHVHGWRVRVEPTPLNLSDEVALRLANRKIYQTFGITKNFELMPRKAWQILHDSGATVFGSHDCDFPTLFEPAPLFERPQAKEPNF